MGEGHRICFKANAIIFNDQNDIFPDSFQQYIDGFGMAMADRIGGGFLYDAV